MKILRTNFSRALVVTAMTMTLAATPLLLAAPAQAADVTFADATLAACVNEQLGQPTGSPISDAQAAGLTSLACMGKGVTNLSGVEALTSLTYLNVTGNSIADLTPLENHPSLQTFTAENNAIIDLTVLGTIPTMINLTLVSNSIVDITPLGSLPNLSTLFLSRNQGIDDLSPLAGKTSLTELRVGSTSLTDVTPVASLTGLRVLYIGDNPGLASLPNMSGLVNLSDFLAPNSSLKDLSPLADLTTLRYVRAEGNEITDISPLADLDTLQVLHLQDNQISDLTPLAGLSALAQLNLNGNQIIDLSPLTTVVPALTYFSAVDQHVVVPDLLVGESRSNPVRTIGGIMIPVASQTGAGVVSPTGDAWTSDSFGRNVFGWTTPAGAGTFSGIIVQDFVGLAPVIETPTLADGETDLEYTQSVTILSDDLPTVTVNGLPAGLIHSELEAAPDGSYTLSVTGTPKTAGTFQVTVNATNYWGTASKTYTLTIAGPSTPTPDIGQGNGQATQLPSTTAPAGDSLAQTGLATVPIVLALTLLIAGSVALFLRRRQPHES